MKMVVNQNILFWLTEKCLSFEEIIYDDWFTLLQDVKYIIFVFWIEMHPYWELKKPLTIIIAGANVRV